MAVVCKLCGTNRIHPIHDEPYGRVFASVIYTHKFEAIKMPIPEDMKFTPKPLPNSGIRKLTLISEGFKPGTDIPDTDTLVFDTATIPELEFHYEEPAFFHDGMFLGPRAVESMTIKFMPLPDENGVYYKNDQFPRRVEIVKTRAQFYCTQCGYEIYHTTHEGVKSWWHKATDRRSCEKVATPASNWKDFV